MRYIVVEVECTDESDADWLKPRIEGAVQEVVHDQDERLDGDVTVDVTISDSAPVYE
jgi:hypothetical protein